MTISVKIKDKLARKIKKISEETRRDSSYHFNKALENYISEQEDLKEALKRLNDKNDSLITSKQLKKSLGL
ncbi:MAG: ribbon-helix-helix domain-containing protein [Chlorobi bacterium]|nr:ribbon-helix-helix domain-containing protein [Chlorobiota bacterium]MCI0717315.1 ribbon-helix-helix domain-containing protein [Chlorobiota bacterium]